MNMLIKIQSRAHILKQFVIATIMAHFYWTLRIQDAPV